MVARAGVRVEGGATDAWQTSRTESINGYNAQIHDAFDGTVRNDELGDMHARSPAFFGELRELQSSAISQNQHIAREADEPDAVLGNTMDLFSRSGGESTEMSDAEFEDLVRRTRFKQPGDM